MKQAERIHHRCRCLDRNFTFEEWIKYLREEKPSDEPVLTVGGEFQFNVNDVCLTPRRPVRIEKPTCKLEVRTAQSLNGRWDYGIDLNILTEGHSCGAGFIDDPEKGFPTEKEAIYACLLDASEDVSRKIGILEKQGDTPDDYEDDEESERQPKPSVVLSSLRAFLKEIQRQKQYYDPKQLSLFDL